MVVGPSKVRPTPRGHQRKHCTPSLSDTPPEHFLGPGHAGRLCPGVPGLSPGSGTARRQGPARRRRWNGPADLYGPAPAIIERRDRRRCPASWVSGQANTPKRCLKGRDMTCQQPQPRHSGAARPRQECYKELPLGHGCCIAVDAKAVAVQGGGGMAGVHAAPPIGELGTTKIGGVFAAQAGPGGRDRQAQQQGTPRWGEGRAHHRYGLRALRPPKGTPHLQRRACEAACLGGASAQRGHSAH